MVAVSRAKGHIDALIDALAVFVHESGAVSVFGNDFLEGEQFGGGHRAEFGEACEADRYEAVGERVLLFESFLDEVDTAGAGVGGLALREALGAAGGGGYVLLGDDLGAEAAWRKFEDVVRLRDDVRCVAGRHG